MRRFDPGVAAVRQHTDELGDPTPCRDCGRTIRRSYHADIGLHRNLELWPVTAEPDWTRDWDHLAHRWQPNTCRPGGTWCAVVFGATRTPFYVEHHCPATNNP